MGVIKKKTGTRGTEGGTKYVCDVCSSDITSTVSPTTTLPSLY
jgi:transcriptional adapter 2-alpha